MFLAQQEARSKTKEETREGLGLVGLLVLGFAF